MGCPKPFNIGTAQLQVLEGIDATLDIGDNSSPFCKISLPFRINLWFGTPGLAHLLPVIAPAITIISMRS
jgi:hypothetical protein